MSHQFSCHTANFPLNLPGLNGIHIKSPSPVKRSGSPVEVLLLDDNGRVTQQTMKWGFAPQWLTDFRHAQPFARAETANTLKMFAAAWRTQRCLIISDGFYQWHHSSGRKKLWQVRGAERPLLLIAGLWTRYRVDANTVYYSCAMLTLPANPQLSVIAERMPAVVSDASLMAWLQGEEEGLALLNRSAQQCRFVTSGLNDS